MTTDMIVHNGLDMMTLGGVLARSGYFQDARDEAQAIVKVLAGQEMGIGAISAMTGIYIVKGRITLSANLMAAQIKRSGKYDYRITRMDDTGCVITFYQAGQPIGESAFDEADAKAAGLLNGDNWKKFPRNMYFARAMSNGAKWYTPDVFSGAVYTRDELDGATEALPPAPPVNVVTGEVIEQPMSAPQLPPAQAKPPAQPERPEPFKQHNGNDAAKDPRQTLIAAVEQFIVCAVSIGIEVEDIDTDLSKRTNDELKTAGKKLREVVVKQIQDLDKELIATAGTQSVSYIPAHVDLLTMRPDDLKALGLRLIERITELSVPVMDEAALAEVDGAVPA